MILGWFRAGGPAGPLLPGQTRASHARHRPQPSRGTQERYPGGGLQPLTRGGGPWGRDREGRKARRQEVRGGGGGGGRGARGDDRKRASARPHTGPDRD